MDQCPRILIVDDNDDMRFMMSRLVESLGYVAQEAASGKEALCHIHRSAPALVILDYNMPEMDGLQVLCSIRSEPDSRAVPVMMFTGADRTLEAKARSLGVDAFVQKGSLDWDELIKQVHDIACGP